MVGLHGKYIFMIFAIVCITLSCVRSSAGQRVSDDDDNDGGNLDAMEQTGNRPAGCPYDFVYLPSINGCYKVVTDKLQWEVAGLRCKTWNKNAHLVIINNAREQNVLGVKLNSYTGCSAWWTAGQRADPGISQSAFVWKTSTFSSCEHSVHEMTYTNWATGQPNNRDNEACLFMGHGGNFQWHDAPCSWSMSPSVCSVCEIETQTP